MTVTLGQCHRDEWMDEARPAARILDNLLSPVGLLGRAECVRPRNKRPLLVRNGRNEHSPRSGRLTEAHSKPSASARPRIAASPGRTRHTCAL